METFSSEDVQNLLNNKFVVVIGDSIQRAIYKDLVNLLQSNQLLRDYHLKQKGEKSFLNDKLIEGGCLGQMSNAKTYREVRQYQTDHHLVRFYIITRCYGEYMESILADLAKPDSPKPDILIMNSCLWDISRYGPFKPSLEDYKTNLQYLCTRMKEVLPRHCLFIWNSTMPVGRRIMGGFLIEDLRWMENHLTYLVKEANFFAMQVMEKFGMDLNDIHYHFRDPMKQLERRVKDGIHWDPLAHRTISNFLLRHICRAWNLPLFERQRAELARQKQRDANNNNRDESIWVTISNNTRGIGRGQQHRRPTPHHHHHQRSNTHDGQVTIPGPVLSSFSDFLTVSQEKMSRILERNSLPVISPKERADQIRYLEKVLIDCDAQLNRMDPNAAGNNTGESFRVRNQLMELCQVSRNMINWLGTDNNNSNNNNNNNNNNCHDNNINIDITSGAIFDFNNNNNGGNNNNNNNSNMFVSEIPLPPGVMPPPPPLVEPMPRPEMHWEPYQNDQLHCTAKNKRHHSRHYNTRY